MKAFIDASLPVGTPVMPLADRVAYVLRVRAGMQYADGLAIKVCRCTSQDLALSAAAQG